MTLKGNIGTFSRDDERAAASGHGPVILIGVLLEDDGVYPVGLLLTRAIDGVLNQLAVIAGEVLDAGDGVAKDYAGTLAAALPVEPGTVIVTDGVEAFADDGFGVLTGDAGGAGTVNYQTGNVAVTFNTAVANLTEITVDYVTRIDGVLDDQVDTADSQAGNYIKHGTCRRDALKVGAVAKAAPSAAVLMLLQDNGIYPLG
jgi:hypothetical protein